MRTLQACTILAAIALTAAGVLLPVDMAVRTRLSLALSPTPDLRVVTVEVDDRALAVFGRWPWPRSLLAQLVARVAEADPAVIGVDIILSEPDPNGAGDLLLAETMGDYGRVVLPMHVESYSLPPEARLYASSGVPVCPVPVLADRGKRQIAPTWATAALRVIIPIAETGGIYRCRHMPSWSGYGRIGLKNSRQVG